MRRFTGEVDAKDLEPSVAENGSLTYEEIELLISDADMMLNKISSLINKNVAEYRPLKQLVADDSERLFKLLRQTYDSQPNG